MLPQMPQDLREALDLGITIFAGEAEERRLDQLLRDTFHREAKPIYNHMDSLPNLAGEVVPFLPFDRVKRTAGAYTTFDAGRGCPFQCSFCTIINVQGRKSRYRSADDVERIVRDNLAQGVDAFFITDDNFARNRQWESVFDRLIALREEEGLRLKLIIQVDTLCHRIPRFIEKAARAGVRQVFIGLENINPANLLAAKKRQNRIAEYRSMLLAWKSASIITFAGYILGFPADTPQSIRRDIETIKAGLPVDLLEFFILTPLPGSEDHRQLWLQGRWMDPDMNKYDTNHVTTDHPTMSRQELQRAWVDAWREFYTVSHMTTMLRRAAKYGIPLGEMIFIQIWFYASVRFSRIHPLEAGYFRLKRRNERRPGMRPERPAAFYLRYGWELLSTHLGLVAVAARLWSAAALIALNPRRKSYQDLSCGGEDATPEIGNELEAGMNLKPNAHR
jgi:hypothetical protein